MPQALSAARGRLAAQRAFDAQAAEAKAARASWEQEQKRLRKAVPKQLWRRARDAWGSELLPWEIGAFGQLVSIRAQLGVLKLLKPNYAAALSSRGVAAGVPWGILAGASGQLGSLSYHLSGRCCIAPLPWANCKGKKDVITRTLPGTSYVQPCRPMASLSHLFLWLLCLV